MTFSFYFLNLLYLEMMFKLLSVNCFGIPLYTFLYLIYIAGIISLLTSLFPSKWQRYIIVGISLLNTIYFSIQLLFFKTFDVYFSLTTFFLADQAVGFIDQAFSIIFANILDIVILLIPVIVSLILFSKFEPKKLNTKSFITQAIISVIAYSLFFVSVAFIDPDISKLYFSSQNNALNHNYFGVIPSSLIELRNNLSDFKEDIVIIDDIEELPNVEEDPTYGPQILDIDFDELIEDESDKNIIALHEYFKNERPSYQNEYTGYFKDKNLILFMAESFNGVVIDKELTPTLYKLTNSGFVFDNFYSPVILSTIGGEFQELTGLYPDLSMLSRVWRTGKNEYPFGIANLFKNQGYATFSYHNHDYNFQDRNIYLGSLGFDYYEACGNGLEAKIDCSYFPKSDKDMIDQTIDEYIDQEHFMVYYATVSGHMNYDFTNNAMSIKHKSEVEDLPYSNRVKAYIATQIELDQALESLLNHLENHGKLDDTVIALVGDHYPYALSLDEINEMATEDKDATIEINRSNFILYNNQMETTHITKTASQIDVLPTIYNLFNLPYDSRLITGKDILDSSYYGLAIFENRSWVSDIGKYYANSNQFVPSKNINISDNYVDTVKQIVQNRIVISSEIMKYNYYAKLKLK